METRERIKEMDDFLHFVINEWPRTRHKYLDTIAARCTRCVNSIKYSPIVDGLCMECRANDVVSAPTSETLRQWQKEFHEIVSTEIENGDRPYDCLVPFSGGKDSAYLLDRLTSEYPRLRILTLLVDNGFMSPLALSNSVAILKKFDVDHVHLTPHRSLFKKTFREAVLRAGSRGGYEAIDRMDGDLLFDICRNVAARQKIPLILSGLSPEQTSRILGAPGFESPDSIEHVTRTESAEHELSDIYEPNEIREYWSQGIARYGKDTPRHLFPFVAWGYDEAAVREQVIKKQLIPPGSENPLATNNEFIPVIIARDYCMLGYCSFEPEFSALIRSGRGVREQWLSLFEAAEYLSLNGIFLPNCITDTLAKIGLSLNEAALTPYAEEAGRTQGRQSESRVAFVS